MRATFSLLAFSILTFPGGVFAQTEPVKAGTLLKQIDAEKPVTLRNVTIAGDLDFTQLKKKTRGGSYGGRVGRVKEYFTKLRADLILEDCVIEGGIVTFREEKKRLLLKENFVAFDAALILRRCEFKGAVTLERMTAYDRVVIEDCVFNKAVRFEKVRFTERPMIRRNKFKTGLINEATNWDSKGGKLVKPTPPRVDENPGIAVVLRNPSSRSIAIQFGDNRWNLSPRGTSTLHATKGTKIFLTKKGRKERVLLTVSPEVAGETFDVTRL